MLSGSSDRKWNSRNVLLDLFLLELFFDVVPHSLEHVSFDSLRIYRIKFWREYKMRAKI